MKDDELAAVAADIQEALKRVERLLVMLLARSEPGSIRVHDEALAVARALGEAAAKLEAEARSRVDQRTSPG